MEHAASRVAKGIMMGAGATLALYAIRRKLESMHTPNMSNPNAWRSLQDLPAEHPYHVPGPPEVEEPPIPLEIIHASPQEMAANLIMAELLQPETT